MTFIRAIAVLTAVVLVASISGCATTTKPAVHIQLTPKQVASVHQQVAKGLRDPESARFGPMIAGFQDHQQRAITVCGWINAKNAFGGYVGYSGFVARFDEGPGGELKLTFVRVQEEGNLDKTLVVQILCNQAGLGLPPR